MGEVDVAPLNVVQNPTAGSDEDVDTVLEVTNLFGDRHPAVDSDDLEFILVVLESVDDSCHL